MEEIWKDIEGFPGYQVSDKGRVRCFRDFHGAITDKYRILHPSINEDGYYYISLYTIERKKVKKRIHRIVADTFLGPNPDLVVNHKDGNKLNNDLRNIEWLTAKENSTKASEAGLYRTRAIRIVETGQTFKSIRDCANFLKVNPPDINHTIAGRYESLKGYHFEYLTESKKQPFLFDYQMDAVKRMKNGCILNGGVGSGKSRTGLYYYFSQQGGSIDPDYIPMENPKDLYIITTAQKRDSLEWENELVPFLLYTEPGKNSYYGNKVVIDSWNNIKKYIDVRDSYFLFDEQRVCGYGAWTKSFLKIAKNNDWILLSATPADVWQDYMPVFIANGFYKNKTDFQRQHIVYSQYSKYPKIEGYQGTGKLMRLRDSILVDMDFERDTVPHHEDVFVRYDISKYKDAMRTRWNPFRNEPMLNASELCYVLRRIVNEDESRQVALMGLFEDHPKMIIFYNFDYERDILHSLFSTYDDVEVAEWSGHAHQPVPDSDSWVYLVQYTAGNAGWNCIKTDTIVFFSQNYSYKIMQQAAGRIDRLTTPYRDLYYYHLRSRSGIDLAISKALSQKKKFNETRWAKW